jgi:predicted ribosomally synthesized peptide with SipW-like signal peptide
MRKITMLVATKVVMLMITGASYAYWTDSLEINTHVVTGTFGWELANVQSGFGVTTKT